MTDTSMTSVLFRALAESVDSGVFLDTKFYVFSRRRNSGKVDLPLAIHANSSVLKQKSSYFHDLLSGGFFESESKDLNGMCPGPEAVSAEEYSYESDSDLDEEEEIDTKEAVYVEEYSHVESGDGDLDEEATENIRAPGHRKPRISDSFDRQPTGVLRTGLEPMHIRSEAADPPDRPVHLGHVICVRDHAYKSWRSLVLYLYSGEIHFRTLRSQGAVSDKRPPSHLQSCSPKSMYRIADKLGLEDLKKKSAEAIRVKLSANNIVKELFSKFTSWYPEIADIEVEVFLSLRDNIAYEELEEMIPEVVQGSIPHCRTVMSKILKACWNPPLQVPKPFAFPVTHVNKAGERGFDGWFN